MDQDLLIQAANRKEYVDGGYITWFRQEFLHNLEKDFMIIDEIDYLTDNENWRIKDE